MLFLYEGEFSSGAFCNIPSENRIDGEDHPSTWAVITDKDSGTGTENKTKWIEPDIKTYMDGSQLNSDFPLLSKAHPVRVLVSEGEMLYIPSLWYHRVTQTCETVGVNYWYDMKFDSPHWCYFNFLQSMKHMNFK